MRRDRSEEMRSDAIQERRDRDAQEREDSTCPECHELAWVDGECRACGHGHVHCGDCGAAMCPGATCQECSS